MTLILYMDLVSPPVRAVLLVAAYLEMALDLKFVDVLKGDQLEPDFLKLNPQHTVPTLKDDDFVLWDSHAINTYLVEKYGNDSLYPKDLQKRALVNQRLHFDSGILFPRLVAIVVPLLREGAKSISKEKAHAAIVGYAFLETFLQGQKFAAGNTLTLADFSIATSVTQLNVFVPIATDRYPEIMRWLNNVQEAAPFFNEINQPAIDAVDKWLKSRLN